MKKIQIFCVLIFATIGLFGFRQARAAVMPTGIPAPSFGLDETVASVYGGPNYSTYWVDNSVACSDSGNGTSASPRCTIPTTSTLAAGSVLQLRGGPYTLSSTWTIGGTGTPAQPIFIHGPDSGNKVEIVASSARQTRLSCTYCVIENLKFTGRDEAILVSNNYVSFRNNEVIGTGTSADGNGAMIITGGTNFIVIANNLVHDGGAWQSATENDMHGLGVGSNEHDIWYLWNTVYHVGGDGVGNGHDANHTTYRLFIGGNNFYENRENGIDLKEVNDVIISENDIHNFTASSSSPGEAIVLHYGPTTDQGPYNVWVISNKIHDAISGLVTSDVQTGIYIIGNILYNNNTGINPDRGGGSAYVYHNTLVDNGEGIISGGSGAALNTLEVHGNIVSNATSGNHLEVYSSTVRALANISNELYYQGGGNVSISWGTVFTSVSSWINGTTVGDNSIQVDPLFINAAGRNYGLTSGSPAINAGFDMFSVASTFTSIWGTSLLKDIAGGVRPNGVWDMGAYEYQGSGTGTPIVGDINQDHIVNSIDYSILNSHWFTSDASSDLNRDGIVNAIDYSVMNANWLRTW